jgi:hypothetical protein
VLCKLTANSDPKHSDTNFYYTTTLAMTSIPISC